MFSWFTSSSPLQNPFPIDLHSHLLPGIDDGVKTLAESVSVIQALQSLGFSGAITTPHVMGDTYRNTNESIRQKLTDLQEYLRIQQINFHISASAEYYLDESLTQRLENGAPLVPFGNNYVLFETNYLSEPYVLKDFIFKASTKGYRLVLAHPERYHYMTLEKVDDLCNRGTLMQVNMLSLSGYYGPVAQKLAERIIEQKNVHFLGSDCHNLQQANLLERVFRTKAFKKALDLPLLNFSLSTP